MRNFHRRIVSGLSVLLLAVPFVRAQGPWFGVKAGLNYSNLYSTDVTDKNARLGFNLGVLARTDPEAAIGLQAELLYGTRGAKFRYSGLLLDQDVTFNTSYIDLPVMVGFRLGQAFELHAGAYAGMLLGASMSTEGDLGSGGRDLDRKDFKGLDYGLVGGLAFNGGPMQIGVRYNYGLAQLADSDVAKLVLGSAKNSYAQLYIALGF